MEGHGSPVPDAETAPRLTTRIPQDKINLNLMGRSFNRINGLEHKV